MSMKKCIRRPATVVMLILMLFTLTACGSDEKGESDNMTTTTTGEETTVPEDNETDDNTGETSSVKGIEDGGIRLPKVEL